MFDIFGEILVLWLFTYSGAFIRWALGGFKRNKFSILLKNTPSKNILATLCFFLIIGVVYSIKSCHFNGL